MLTTSKQYYLTLPKILDCPDSHPDSEQMTTTMVDRREEKLLSLFVPCNHNQGGDVII